MTKTRFRRSPALITALALTGATLLPAGTAAASLQALPAQVAVAAVAAAVAPADAAPLTNLAHLDFLLDTASPGVIDGHDSYRLAESPQLTFPWTYADARDGGTFERVGGGPLDPVTGYWGQGAYNVDDVARTAVVYVRDWQQTGAETSRQKAYELLRSTAYFQTTSGPNAGNVVLWMQPDGSLNPSPEPVELPNPSDSGDSYWLARSIWAFGEGFAAFQSVDPQFATFLQDRLQLGVDALNRETLDSYGEYANADGVDVPAWLIVDGADASAEAVLGLAAYSAKVPDDVAAATALERLAEGIAEMGAGDTRSWPYGAILPWAQSRTLWHSWASQMPAALAAASVTLDNKRLLRPAIDDSARFTPTLLTAGGPDNGWSPTPTDTVQIAYGADSRLQSLLAVADAADRPGLRQLAAIMGSWFFGMNKAGVPIYNPATGVTFDGVQADGGINRNSGAESTIHGLLAMIALDRNPDVAAAAQSATQVSEIDGLSVVEAESATATTGIVVTPESSWTGESQYGGGAYLDLTDGQTATIPIGSSMPRYLEPVTFQPENGSARSLWTSATAASGTTAPAPTTPLGRLRETVGDQGITPTAGALLPDLLRTAVPASDDTVSVTVSRGAVRLDAVIDRPLVSRLLLTGTEGAVGGPSTELVNSASKQRLTTTVGTAGATSTLRNYDSQARLTEEREIMGLAQVLLEPGGFAMVTDHP